MVIRKLSSTVLWQLLTPGRTKSMRLVWRNSLCASREAGLTFKIGPPHKNSILARGLQVKHQGKQAPRQDENNLN